MTFYQNKFLIKSSNNTSKKLFCDKTDKETLSLNLTKNINDDNLIKVIQLPLLRKYRSLW